MSEPGLAQFRICSAGFSKDKHKCSRLKYLCAGKCAAPWWSLYGNTRQSGEHKEHSEAAHFPSEIKLLLQVLRAACTCSMNWAGKGVCMAQIITTLRWPTFKLISWEAYNCVFLFLFPYGFQVTATHSPSLQHMKSIKFGLVPRHRIPDGSRSFWTSTSNNSCVKEQIFQFFLFAPAPPPPSLHRLHLRPGASHKSDVLKAQDRGAIRRPTKTWIIKDGERAGTCCRGKWPKTRSLSLTII